MLKIANLMTWLTLREKGVCQMHVSGVREEHAKTLRTLSLYADSPCARTLDVMLSNAPCSVCETIDIALAACVQIR